jgi:membrane dipeptidase
MATQISEAATRLQREAFVVDGLFVSSPGPHTIRRLQRIGYNAVNWTIGGHADSLESALSKIATFYWLRDELPDQVQIVRSAADLDGRGDDGIMRIVMGFQGAEPVGHHFHFVSIFHALGLRLIQLTYNEANALGYGCLESDDRGLTHLGKQVVREMNRLGMIVDLTHAGERTSLDAIETSSDPVIFSHSNAKAVRDNPRNLTDRQMKAVAERGGVVGIASFADFVGDTRQGQPTFEQMLDHVAYAVELIGVDHVGIGSDIFETTGAGGIWWNANTKRRYPEICGAMDEHMHGIQGFESWEEFGNLTDGLLRRGFAEDDVRKIIGGNFRRVFQQILR